MPALTCLNRTLKHVAQYSPLLSDPIKRQIQTLPSQQANLKQRFSPDQLPLSELPSFISGAYKLDVPVYTVWGACEDVRVLEKFRAGEYRVPNLHIIDEASSRLLDVGGIKLRLLGLGGAVVMHKLFDNGEGRTTIAGGQGTMWTTLLQMGELVDTANRVYDPTETRVFVTHASPAREGLLNQLSVTLKADFSISAGLHFRYGSSYNEFSVNPTLDHYRGKLAASKASFNDVWETVKGEVEPAVNGNEAQKQLLTNALEIVNKMPSVANGGNPFGGAVPGQGAGGQVDESAFKNMWNFNLADAAFGYLVLEVDNGRIGTEMRAQGFNFAHRGTGGKAGPPTAPGNSMQPAQMPIRGGGPNSGEPAGFHQGQQQHRPSQPGQQPAAVPKAPTPAQGARASPAPVAPASQAKPSTPQPTAAAGSSTATNGTPAAEQPKSTPTPKPQTPAADKKPSLGLFIHNMESEEQCRELFSEEDRANITKVEKHGRNNHVVHFSSHDAARLALEHQPADHKQGGGQARFTQPGQPRKPNIKWYDDRGPSGRNVSGTPGGAGQWQASQRGGATPGATRGGYTSNASDSEGGRGRGGFRGGRGRGEGRGRGGRGGRGGKSEGEGGATPAATTPAPKPAEGGS